MPHHFQDMLRTRWAKAPSISSRFWSKVNKTETCWLWTGAGSQSGLGHGRFALTHDKLVGAHRFAYEACIGVIPEGRQLDHLCRNPSCVRPDHLEIVTPHENTMRGLGPAARNARTTECRRGHPYDEANTYIHRGRRYCRQCRKRRWVSSRPCSQPTCLQPHKARGLCNRHYMQAYHSR